MLIEVPGTTTAKGRESVRESRKHRTGVLTPGRSNMNELTDKNDQAFLDACGALNLEPGAMVESRKERFVVTEFLNDPLLWLEAELPYHTYRTRGAAQEVANGIDRMIQEGKRTGLGKYGCSSRAFKDEIGYSVRIHIDRTVMMV
jgi:hypothetical protein